MLNYQEETLDNVDESMRSLYAEKDGKFVLGIAGMPEPEDVSGIKAKMTELLAEKKEAAAKTLKAEGEAETARLEAAKKNGDTDALEKSWKEKYDNTVATLKGEYEPKLSELQTLLHESTVIAKATQIASELAVTGSTKALLPHIQSRLAMEVKDGKAITIVTDAMGKPSALTLEELKNEFIGDEAFAPLIVGSKATGGGANGSDGGAGNKTLKRADFTAKAPQEQMAFVKDGGKIID